METELVAKFLKHLLSCTEAVLQKEEVESYDVISLRRELSQLKRKRPTEDLVDGS